MIFTGCDPGVSTFGVAQVRLENGRLTLVNLVDAQKVGNPDKRRWRVRSFRLSGESGEEVDFSADLPSWRVLLETGVMPGFSAYVEDIVWYADKGRPQEGRGKPVLDLASSAGAFEGILGSVHESIGRVPSRVWRATVLGISPKTSASDAEKCALASVGLLLKNRVPPWLSGHGAEAIAIAIYAKTQTLNGTDGGSR